MINIITSLFVSLLARPITFAWDGAVSNARTYTLEDMDILLEGLNDDDYLWEKGVIDGKSKKVYMLGLHKK